MKANDTQIGGKHYRTAYQHWDWVTDIGMGYLPAQVTKYLKRWRDKNGLEDVQKAGHFLDKMIEVHGIVVRQRIELPAMYISEMTTRYLNENGITGSEAHVSSILSNWKTPSDLYIARQYITELAVKLGQRVITTPSPNRRDGNRGSGPFVDDESIHAKSSE